MEREKKVETIESKFIGIERFLSVAVAVSFFLLETQNIKDIMT